MKNIKPIHVIIMVILVLFALAVVQWMTLPKRGPTPTAELGTGADQ